jgi:two-component sensor histidine kinase
MTAQKQLDAVAPDSDGAPMATGIGLAHLDECARHVFANRCYYEMLGLSPADVIGRSLGEVLGDPSAPLTEAAIAGSALHIAQMALAPRGRQSFLAAAWINPIMRDGASRGSVCSLVDTSIYERAKDAADRELKHRMRNVFAIAQAIVGQSLRGAASPNDAVAVVTQRLAAISGVTAGMMSARYSNLTIKGVVERAVTVHPCDPARISIDGVDVDVGSKAALAIGLALHELGTNALRYGALSTAEGRVSLVWSVDEAGNEPVLRMIWRERAGPPVVPPSRKGFGTRLIVDNLSSDVQGRSELTFPPEGVQWVLEAPLTALSD